MYAFEVAGESQNSPNMPRVMQVIHLSSLVSHLIYPIFGRLYPLARVDFFLVIQAPLFHVHSRKPFKPLLYTITQLM